MQKWYKGKRKISIDEKIKNLKIYKDPVNKALAVAVVITIIVTTISIIKRNKEASQEATNSIRVEDGIDNIDCIGNSEEPVKILCYKRAS